MRPIAMMLGALLALAVPLAGQAQVPREYPDDADIWPLADPDKPQDVLAREAAEAATVEAACDSGDLAGCAALGRAYRDGAGRPQNRPVAELLFRQACDGAEAAGCLALGEQLHKLDDKGAQEEALIALRRGCTLGAREACDQVERISADTAARAADRHRLDRECRDGEVDSCNALLNEHLDDTVELTAGLRETLAQGCRAGAAQACYRLGETAFAEGRGPPENRVKALTLFDEACRFDQYRCFISEQIRARPVLVQTCQAGVMADCYALGRIYSAEFSLLHSPTEALELLGKACNGGEAMACAEAASLIGDDASPDAIARADQWLAKGCETGVHLDCLRLGLRLTEDQRAPSDRERGYAMLVAECEDGNKMMCERLYKRAGADPVAPLLVADERFGPPAEPTDAAEEARRLAENLAMEAENERFDPCTRTSVNFRGTTYSDTICEAVQRISGGYQLRPGQAPWQALLWRPAELNGQPLSAGQRVACGGSLIRAGWILTAAHCIVDKNGKSLIGPGHRIRLGVYNPQADEGVTYPILGAVHHPTYHEPSRAFDIALIRFDPRAGKKGAETNAIASIRLDPLSLEEREIAGGMPVYTYGWGLTKFRGKTSDHLRGARMQLEDPEACTRRTKFRGSLLKDAVLCAAAPDRSQACDGDSGGPLITYGDAVKGPTVIGVVSAGEKCGSTGVPSRYTRVAKVRGWLDDILTGRKPVPGL